MTRLYLPSSPTGREQSFWREPLKPPNERESRDLLNSWFRTWPVAAAYANECRRSSSAVRIGTAVHEAIASALTLGEACFDWDFLREFELRAVVQRYPVLMLPPPRTVQGPKHCSLGALLRRSTP